MSESTLAKITHCWKSHVMAQMFAYLDLYSCLLIGLSFIYRVSMKESSVAKLGSVCRVVYRILAIISIISSDYPHAFLKKCRGYCNRLRPSVTLSPPKPLDEIQPNLVCELLT